MNKLQFVLRKSTKAMSSWLFNLPVRGISFIERIDQIYETIQPPEIDETIAATLSPLSINIYKTLHETSSRVELLNKELMASVTAQADQNSSAMVLPPDLLQ